MNKPAAQITFEKWVELCDIPHGWPALSWQQLPAEAKDGWDELTRTAWRARNAELDPHNKPWATAEQIDGARPVTEWNPCTCLGTMIPSWCAQHNNYGEEVTS